MKKITKSLLNWLPAITLGIVLGSFLQLTQAWQEPSSNPPNSNIGAPVTTGSASQYKTGALAVEGILRGWNAIQTMDEFCFGSDCRSDWQDLYKSGDKVCIESGGCVDVTDNYIGDSGTHYAGGTLNMSGSDITNVDDLRLNDIYKDGWGDIDIYDDVSLKYNNIHHLKEPYYRADAATKGYVDDEIDENGILKDCRFIATTGSEFSCNIDEYMIHGHCSISHGVVENFTSRRGMRCIENSDGEVVNSNITAICCNRYF